MKLFNVYSQKITHYTISNGLIDNKITGLAIDKNNNIWCVYAFGGLSKFEGSVWKSVESPASGDQLRSIFIDSGNNIWIGGTSTIYWLHDSTWTSFSDFPESQSWAYIRDINEDKEGNIWFAGRGVLKYNGTGFEVYKEDDGLVNNSVLSICIDSNNVKWAGTLMGISRFDGQSWQNFNYSKDSSLHLSEVYGITFDEQNQVYASFYKGIAKFEEDGFVSEVQYNTNSHEFFASKHNSGNVICVADGYMFSLTATGWNQTLYYNNGFAACVVQDIYGNVWIGDINNGVYKISYESIISGSRTDEDIKVIFDYRINRLEIPDSKINSITIYNINGVKVCEKFNSNSVILNKYTEGLYLVVIKTFENHTIARKIIINN